MSILNTLGNAARNTVVAGAKMYGSSRRFIKNNIGKRMKHHFLDRDALEIQQAKQDGWGAVLRTKFKILFRKNLDKLVVYLTAGWVGIIAPLLPLFMVVAFCVVLIGGSAATVTLPVTELGVDGLTFKGGVTNLTGLQGGTSTGVAGERYKWDELAKVETLSNNYDKNLYRYCMLWYEALTDAVDSQGNKIDLSNTVCMDGLVATGEVETGLRFFINESQGNVLEQIEDYNTAKEYKGTIAMSQNLLGLSNFSKWAKYNKVTSTKDARYLPDAIYNSVCESKDAYDKFFRDNPSADSKTTGHFYGKYFEAAFTKYGLDWNDTHAKTLMSNFMLYYKHAGGNWNNDWAEAMADMVVWMYKNYFEDGNMDILKVNPVTFSKMDSCTLQGFSIGVNKVGSFTMSGDSIKNVVGKSRGETIPALLLYKGQQQNDAMYYEYCFKAPDGQKYLQTFNTYAMKQGVYSQAVMALGVGFTYPAIGRYVMLDVVQKLGYKAEDFTFDDLGYLCYSKTANGNASNTVNTGDCLLNDETLSIIAGIINAEAGGNGKYSSYTQDELARCQAVAAVMYNTLHCEDKYDGTSDINDAVLKMVTYPSRYSTVKSGTGGTKTFKVKGVDYYINGTVNDDKCILAVKSIFTNDGTVQQSALENIKLYMLSNNGSKTVTIDNIKRACGFWGNNKGYPTFGTALGKFSGVTNYFVYQPNYSTSHWKF